MKTAPKINKKPKMHEDIRDLYLTVRDDIENAISRLEGDLFIAEDDPYFEDLSYIYDRLLGLKFSIDNTLSK
ncbi:MAG: hypothetical protein J6S67_13450 [Methanobrevibacter sp.]|nr:hypothetical protein [Methanobrevibacter sp.]